MRSFMKSILVIISLMAVSTAFAGEWMRPAKTDGEVLTYVGYIQVERDRLYDTRAKEFNGNYFLGETAEGGKRVPLYADWYHITSRIVSLKARITGTVRHMKSGDQLQISTLEILNEQ